ncbi:MAG TPA: hypothetical protein VFQ53_17295 [Kofleriaceae bacterium]|nr:hypothetical protein [Kofleriaceae bacterium]
MMGIGSSPIPTATLPKVPLTRERKQMILIQVAVWLVLALPSLVQILLLVSAVSGRFGYPYDLEWMEGGMLHHAQRIRDGTGIYVPPSVDFIPYLYTPLYPSLIALFGGAFGVSYQVGRAISVAALGGIVIVALVHITNNRHMHQRIGPAITGALLALGLFAAAYPFVEGWYDLARADTLFLFLVTAGISALPRWAATGHGIAGHGKVAAAAALLALAFFCKQTGIFYVALGGVIVVAIAWRRAPIYIAVTGLIGIGGTLILSSATNGWFWTYVSKIHRAHDFNMDRFWASFGNILWHFPAMTIVIVVALGLVGYTRYRKRVLPRGAHPLLLWSATYAVSTLVGAIGWGTQFAHFNAYMPALLHGALAAGAAVPAVHACARLLWGDRPRLELVATGSAAAVALLLGITCLIHRWSPSRYVPTRADVEAGDRLIARLRSIDGEVWMPSHPWYAYMAGKTPRVHRMGIIDVTTRSSRTVEGLDGALDKHAFAAIIFDNVDLNNREHLPAILRNYRPALKLPKNERPRLYTGATIVPDSMWVPSVPAIPPKGAHSVFDFETATWGAWTRSGAAWGNGPETTALPGQEPVLGATGLRFGTSMHGGESGVGRMTSPVFLLDGTKLTLRLGGGADPTKLRAELWVDTNIVEAVAVPQPGGDTLQTMTINIPEAYRGKLAKLVFVDDSPTSHLDVDDVWIWQ